MVIDETKLEHSPIQENDVDTAVCECWKVVLMGYGCGMVLGMIMGCFIFLLRKPQWIVKIVEREPKRKVRRPNNRHKGRRNWCPCVILLVLNMYH